MLAPADNVLTFGAAVAFVALCVGGPAGFDPRSLHHILLFTSVSDKYSVHVIHHVQNCDNNEVS